MRPRRNPRAGQQQQNYSQIKPNENFVHIFINHKPAICLCDTGAIVSSMSQKFCKYLKLTPMPPEEDCNLIAANGSPIETIGVVNVDVAMQGYIQPWTFYVLKSLAHDVILAQDFLQAANAIIDCANNNITLFDGLVSLYMSNRADSRNTLRLAQSVIIPAASQAIVKLIIPRLWQNKTSLIESYSPIKNKFLAMAATVIHPRSNVAIGRILNAGLTPRKLKAGMRLATISAIDLNDPFNKAVLMPKTNSAQNEPKTEDQQENRPPHAERLKYLQQIGLKFDNPNLSTEQLEQLTELLYDYREIFCSEVSQLPVSKLEPYKIELKDNVVVRRKRYPMSLQNEEILDKYCDEMIKAGICEKSTSAYNSPILLLRKSSYNPAHPTD
jgi:hypothetical protein